MTQHTDCLGCKLAHKIYPVHVVYEDEYVCCILDHDPYNEGHTMILPKQHYEDVDHLDMETANAIMRASMLISKSLKELYHPDGITVCQNGGVFSELTHYHMHVVPRYQNQSFASSYSDEPIPNEAEKARLPQTRSDLEQMIRTKKGTSST